MAILYGKLLGEVTVDTSNNTFHISRAGFDHGNEKLITLTSGKYSDVRMLCNDAGDNSIQSTLRGIDPGNAYTVAVNDSTGIVTISGTNTFSIRWEDEPLRNLLGFSADVDGANSHASPSKHENSFYPDRPFWWYETDKTETDFAMTVAHDGSLTSDYFYERTTGRFEYLWETSAEENRFLTFWEDVLRKRFSFNMYRNRDDNTSFDRSTNTDGYSRWKIHESVKGFTGAYPYRPYASLRRTAFELRKDINDSSFLSGAV